MVVLPVRVPTSVMSGVVRAMMRALGLRRGSRLRRTLSSRRQRKRKCENENSQQASHVQYSPLEEILPKIELKHIAAKKQGEKRKSEKAVPKWNAPASTPQACLQHADHSKLLCNDLSLPDEHQRHNAHGKEGESQNKTSLGLGSGNAKKAANHIHE
jgi:hypothetical protein